MEFLLGAAFAISIPIFYIYGLFKFFTSYKKSQSAELIKHGDKEEILAALIAKLSEEASKNPSKRISDLLSDYRREYEELKDSSGGTTEVTHIAAEEKGETKSLAQSEVSDLWSNWYSNNSINLLLYIGAFLIVASASIFVGFQWQTIEGTFKAVIISGLALAFFGFGVWFYSVPKIRNAGSTFTAIAGLLIPFCGIGWYNFVLKDAGVSFGMVWFITSFVCIAYYVSMMLWQKHIFYAYISNVGVFSLMLSIVNVYGLNNEFYVVSGILTTYVLFISRIALSKSGNKEYDKFIRPTEISENIILPVSLIYGFSVAMSYDKLYSFEASLSLFLATVYYFFSYIFSKRVILLAVCAILFPLSIGVFYKWLKFPDSTLSYTIDLVAGLYLVFAYIFSKYKRVEEADINIILSLFFSVAVFVFSTFLNFEPVHLVILSLIPAMLGILASYIKNKPEILGLTSLFIGICGYIFINNFLALENKSEITSIFYMGLGSIYYLLSVYFKRGPGYLRVFTLSNVGYFLLAPLFVFENSLYICLESLYFSAVALSAAFIFDKKGLAYLSNGLLFAALFALLSYLNIANQYYPLYFSGLGGLLYIVSWFLEPELQKVYKNSSFAALLVTPIVFGLQSFDIYGDKGSLEWYSLISAYIATIIISFEASVRKELNFAYFASAVAVATVLWQIKLLDFTDIQAYIIPLGLYFMGLAFTRKMKNDQEHRKVLDTVGTAILIVPTIFQAFGGGYKYALLMGVEGTLLLGLGITLGQYKVYSYAGILAIVLAVISQTYEYLFSLPRWLITGVGGIVFLGVAITLLLRRKEQ